MVSQRSISTAIWDGAAASKRSVRTANNSAGSAPHWESLSANSQRDKSQQNLDRQRRTRSPILPRPVLTGTPLAVIYLGSNPHSTVASTRKGSVRGCGGNSGLGRGVG